MGNCVAGGGYLPVLVRQACDDRGLRPVSRRSGPRQRIQQAVDSGKLDAAAAVTNEALIAAGVISKPRDGVKILGQGAITAKLAFEVAAASKSAIASIEGAGGSVKLLAASVAE